MRHADDPLLSRGVFGVEAFDGDVSLGLFPNREAAISAVSDRRGRKSRSNGGEPRTAFGEEQAPQDKSSPSSASDIDTRTVTVTFFPNKSAQSQRRNDLTLPQLAEQIRLQTGPSKLELPWLKLRSSETSEATRTACAPTPTRKQITGIEVEHDKGEIAFDAAIADAAQGQAPRAALHLASPTCPAAKERWRILLPLSSNLPPDDAREAGRARQRAVRRQARAARASSCRRRISTAASMTTPPTASR